jgi:hypothetical protein
MKDKDVNRSLNESELGRLKGILFPRKPKKNSMTLPTSEEEPPLRPKPISTDIKTEIEKLRGQICTMLDKGIPHEMEGQ